MKLSVFQDDFEVATLDELRRHLCTRFEKEFGSFWLWRESGSSMALMVRGDDAYIHFFPEKGHPGFQPEESEQGGDECVEFRADNFELTPMPRSLVLSATKGISIFEEYFTTGAKSELIIWTEL
jgi:hypothetical protein